MPRVIENIQSHQIEAFRLRFCLQLHELHKEVYEETVNWMIISKVYIVLEYVTITKICG